MRTNQRIAIGLLVFTSHAFTLQAANSAREPEQSPHLVSPVAREGDARVGSACPTFAWTSVPEALGYELAIYATANGEVGESQVPLVRVEIPAGATSWTPNLEQCLEPGRYAWAMGTLGDGDPNPRWSEPALFRVVARQANDRSPGGPHRAVAEERDFGGQDWSPAAVPSAAGGLRRATAAAFAPALCVGGVTPGEFSDVPMSDPFCPWIKRSALDGIFLGCGGGNYCPDNPVTRKQLALAVERVMRGTDGWRPELGDGAAANLPPGNTKITTLDAAGADVEDTGFSNSITVGVDGLGLISYYDVSNGDLKVAHCSNVECDAAAITALDAPGTDNEDVGTLSSITIGSDGLGLIGYADTTNGDLKVAHCSNVECNAATFATLDLPGADPDAVGLYTSIAIGSDGRGLISYYDATNLDLKIAHCSDLLCSAATKTTLDAGGNVGLNTSITIGADGFGLISYYDAGNQDLKVAHCSNLDCSAATITLLDGAGENVGFYTAITTGVDGRGLIAYRDSSNGDLKVAHCSNVDCSAATITSLDAPGVDSANVGQYTSITIGTDGLGLISYFDITNGDLKVAHCSNVECSSATITFQDAPGAEVENVGQYTSITIGADGFGLISYYDVTNTDLKVAHCSNLLCLPFFRRR